jgi:hypothetical protein
MFTAVPGGGTMGAADLVSLAMAADLLREARTVAGVPAKIGSAAEPPEMTASPSGAVVALTVRCGDANLAADLANAWADGLARRLNDWSGGGVELQRRIRAQVTAARADCDKAQKELAEQLAKSPAPVIEARLAQARDALRRAVEQETGGVQAAQEKLAALQAQLEAAGAELFEPTQKRDCARGLYSALVGLEAQVDAAQEIAGPRARRAGAALPPADYLPRATRRNAVMGGVLGLLLGLLVGAARRRACMPARDPS